jgi:integrase
MWIARWRVDKRYRQAVLGPADDVIEVGTLDYRAAVKQALETVGTARITARALADGPALTVRLAVEAYIAVRNARDSRRVGRETRSDSARRLEKYVIGREKLRKGEAVVASPLASVALHELTEANLRDWRISLPNSLKATAKQRLTSDLKAALNAACEQHRARVPAGLPGIIKLGLRAELADEDDAVPLARENQILSDSQVSSLVQAVRELDEEQGWEGDLFRLIVVMAATGARFSQVARLRVVDVQTGAGRLMIPPSRKGRGVKSGHTPVPVGKDVLDTLIPILSGRPKGAMLLERWRYEQQPGSIRWRKAARGAWQTPSEIVRPWGEIRKRTGLPDVVPYALRHSSIVRGIRANLPLRLVAALHDTSVVMIERHYARYIAGGLDALAAQAVVPLLSTGETTLQTR